MTFLAVENGTSVLVFQFLSFRILSNSGQMEKKISEEKILLCGALLFDIKMNGETAIRTGVHHAKIMSFGGQIIASHCFYLEV